MLLADNFTAGNPSKDRVLKLSYMERKIYDFRGGRASSLRGELGWTLKELANAVEKIMGREIGEAQLSLIENGKRSPSLSLAVAISRALQASMDYLCGISDNDRTSAGEDEVTVVVRSESERARIQRIAYRFLDLNPQDQDRIADMIDRLSGVPATTNQERLAKALATLTELVGTGVEVRSGKG